jgi:hypothetical protein
MVACWLGLSAIVSQLLQFGANPDGARDEALLGLKREPEKHSATSRSWSCCRPMRQGTDLVRAQSNKMLQSQAERVYTVTDWFDGARLGIADYQGRPHLYESRWDDSKDFWEGEDGGKEYGYYYWLSPIDTKIFELGLEAWGIWQRWRGAWDRGEVDISTHPALPQDRERYNQIQLLLGDALKPGRPDSFLRVGDFGRESVRWRSPAEHARK